MILTEQEVLYFLIETSDMEWYQSGVGAPSAVAHIMKVNFQQRTIVLPKGEFSLDFFLCLVRDMHLRLHHYDNPNREPS